MKLNKKIVELIINILIIVSFPFVIFGIIVYTPFGYMIKLIFLMIGISFSLLKICDLSDWIIDYMFMEKKRNNDERKSK